MIKDRRSLLTVFVIIMMCLNLFACSSNINTILPPEQEIETPDLTPSDEYLQVHFIDVGQADAILIIGPKEQYIMIDAGNNEDSDLVVNYLKNLGVKALKAVIGTHPHEDHIGGLDAVISNFNVEKVYMPKVANTTETFKDVLLAVQAKGLKVTTASKGVSIPLEGMTAEFLGPVGTAYEDLNNYSAVLKLTYKNIGFLFQGDAEVISEKEILKSDAASKLDAEVIKIGHHGSSSSTTPEYIDRVQPKYAVIMVGAGNKYNHPHKETMDILNKRKISIYRTDHNKTIIATSDGVTVTFNADHGESGNSGGAVNQTPNMPQEKQYVDANGNGLIKGNINSKGEKIYHMPGGTYYDRTIPEVWFKTESEAKAAGFRKSQG